MKDQALYDKFWDSLIADVDEKQSFPAIRPLLAHYTSIAGLEGIVRNSEIWFSHPLAMNDSEELRFGMRAGAAAFRESHALRHACQSDKRFEFLLRAFDDAFRRFWNEHAFDTYVFCTSLHGADDNEGRLSMWRGYGGNGSGAAIVLNTEKLNEDATSPLILSRVIYATRAQRQAWIQSRIAILAESITKLHLTDDQLSLPARAFLERLTLFSLFTKDIGFLEENEWRAVYMPSRDLKKLYLTMLGYSIGPGGLLPRLKFKVAPLAGVVGSDASLGKLLDRIILGPSQSGPLALETVKRMLRQLGHRKLAERVVASTIPYRP